MVFGTGVASASPGSVVTSFGTNGSVVNTFGPDSTPSSGSDGVAVASNGDIYEVGVAQISGSGVSGPSEVYLARHLPSGALDTSFGNGGVVYENVGAGSSPSTGIAGSPFQPTAFVALTPSGNPVIATVATAATSGDTQMVVLEFSQSGALNTAFNSTGVYKVSLGTSSGPGGLAIQSNGDVVLTGGVETASTSEFFAERLTSGGALDPTFGSAGVEELALGSSNSEGFGALVQSNGDLVFGGEGQDVSGQTAFAITRLTASGQPDGSFGTNGTAYAQPSNASSPGAEAISVAATPDGGYAVAGLADAAPIPPTTSSTIAAAVAHFTASGKVDTAFGNNGRVLLSSAVLPVSLATGIFAQNDGKLLLTGTGITGVTGGPMVARLNTNGTLDSSFGSGGIDITGLSQPYEGIAMAAAPTSGGNLVLSGYGEPTSGTGGTTSFVSEVNIDTAPAVSFIYAPTTVKVGVAVEFAASAIPDPGEPITQVSWDLGSGKFGDATGTTATKTFTQPGTYTVRVQATDAYGLSTISPRAITVIGPSMKVGTIKIAHGKVSVKLSCKTAICTVGATLATVEHLKGKKVMRLSASGHGKLTKIGSAKLKIAAGSSKTVTLKLNGAGKELLKKFASVPARASFVITDSHNKTLQRTVRIR